MVKTGNECQHTDYMSNCYGSLLRGSVVPVKFLLVLLNTLWCGLGTEHAAYRGT